MSIVPLERLNNHRKFLVKHRIDYEKVAVDTKRTSLDPDDGKARFFERALARTKQSEIQSKNPTSEGYIFKIWTFISFLLFCLAVVEGGLLVGKYPNRCLTNNNNTTLFQTIVVARQEDNNNNSQ